jgi:hypothetical protein
MDRLPKSADRRGDLGGSYGYGYQDCGSHRRRTSQGPLMGAPNDLNQRWVMDLGLPEPDAGEGGKPLFLPPSCTSKAPEGYHAAVATTNRVLVLIRAIPPGGDNEAAQAMMKTFKVYPLNRPSDWKEPSWSSSGDVSPDFGRGFALLWMLCETLSEAGYATGAFGKWHLCSGRSLRTHDGRSQGREQSRACGLRS